MNKLLFIFLLSLTFSAYAFSTDRTPENFLVISDPHLNTHVSHQMDINPAKQDQNNDLDKTTFNTLLKTLTQETTLPKPKFILLLGDIVGHERLTETTVFDSETEVFEKLKTHFPDIPIFYIFGNNDSFDANYGPFTTSPNKSPYLVATLSGWQNGFLSSGTLCEKEKHFPCLLNEDANNGYYSAYLEPKLRLIALNTVLFSPRRVNVTEQDAQIELAWLEKQLVAAESNQESVLLAMHIPPGNNVYDHSSFLLPNDNAALLKIIQAYKHIIIGSLASHTHMEELKILKNVNNQIIGDVLFTAGLSTSHGNAPTVKTFYLAKNDTAWELTNYQTFHFTDTKTLQSLYNYNQTYCESQTKSNIMRCLDKVTLDKFKSYFSAGNPNFAGEIKSPEDIFIEIK